jgi:DNA-binding HxlR family transcriptional regulator
MKNKNKHKQLINDKVLDEIAEQWVRLILSQINNNSNNSEEIPR